MTKFTSNGDYIFPFDAVYYWIKHVFMWSYQSGATNIDGIIRLPWRLLNIAVFYLFGNLAVSYFYLALSFIIVFCSFYYFCRKFLHLRNHLTIIIGSLLFTFNPIFLGNTSKIGLVAAAAILPLCLTLLSQAFVLKRLSYLILCIFALNFSLLHPFTFTVNLVVVVIYFVYLAMKHWDFVKKNLVKFFIILLTALLLNLYFILPVMNLGTVDKSSLSQELSDKPVDYAWLVDVANTDDIFTALSLSKNVLKDFEFYQPGYELIFFSAVFALYILFIGLYLYVEKRMNSADKQLFILLTSGFIILALLATATFLYVGDLLKFLIKLPGGWMFRSPLKWQLYVPFVLFGALLVLTRYIKTKRLQWAINGALVAILVLANAVLFLEINQKLLTPRSLSHFAQLQRQDLDQKTLVFIGGDGCVDFSRDNPSIMTELNQVLISENTQVKRIDNSQLGAMNIQDYDYVLGCTLDSTTIQKQLSQFHEITTFADGTFRLLKNTQPLPGVFATDTVYALGVQPNVPEIRDVASFALDEKEFNFVSEKSHTKDTIKLRNVFKDITTQSIQNGRITATIPPTKSSTQELTVRDTGRPLFYLTNEQHITISPKSFDGSTQIQFKNGLGRLPIPHTSITIEYIDDSFAYQNSIPNPSLENGLWKKEVGDCNNYDDNPKIAMKQDTDQKSQGRQSLQLEATRHTACTGPDQIQVKPGATYIFDFQYQTTNAQYGGYFVGFDNDKKQDIRMRLDDDGSEWHMATKAIRVPNNAHAMSMYVYAYPDEQTGEKTQVNYDNFHLVQIPDVINSFYVEDSKQESTQLPTKVAYQIINPTYKTVTISNASKPFYLGMRENYHDKWRLTLGQQGGGLRFPWGSTTNTAGSEHFLLNNGINGWYVDPTQLCRDSPVGCELNSDGTYNLKLSIDFEPQSWFLLGAVVSSMTVIGCIVYLTYDWRVHRRKEDTRHAVD